MSEQEKRKETPIDEREFILLLNSMIQSLAQQLFDMQNVSKQIQMYKDTNHIVRFYLTEDDMPGFRPEKKPPMGFKRE